MIPLHPPGMCGVQVLCIDFKFLLHEIPLPKILMYTVIYPSLLCSCREGSCNEHVASYVAPLAEVYHC